MSRRTLEQGVVSLVEKHGIWAVEASLRMYKIAMLPREISRQLENINKAPNEVKSREVKVPMSLPTPPTTNDDKETQ